MEGAAGKEESGRRPAGADRLTMRYRERYSRLDRLLHRLAFSSFEVQKALADVEDRLCARRLAGIEIDRPVFITALPRAGTTLLLETLDSLDLFATHTYRNMPFLLVPLFWNAVTLPFHAPHVAVERAHGDGMTIGFDSPEAFEEVVWRAFWQDRYLEDRIAVWAAGDEDVHGEFEPFIRTHVAKMIALRRAQRPGALRYLSKNNANLARIPKIIRLFPDAVILVAFRNPLDHAASMLRQHLNFLDLHAAEPFARRYMADVGHFEFGADLRPIDFGHWLRGGDVDPPQGANFWLRYWCAAYAHVLANPCGHVVFVDYDALCADPASILRRIGAAAGIDASTDPAALAGRIRAPVRYDADILDVDRNLLDAAIELHHELQARSIGHIA